MSGLSRCPMCNRYYTYSDEFDIALSEGCESAAKYYKAVIKCQCGNKDVAGGESVIMNFEPYDECIMMFGFKYDETKHKDLQIFDAVMLIECEESDPYQMASTYHHDHGSSLIPGNPGRTIYLKPEQPDILGSINGVTIDTNVSYEEMIEPPELGNELQHEHHVECREPSDTIGRGLKIPQIFSDFDGDYVSNKSAVIFEAFCEQYPQSPTHRLNRKLFTSWFKRNKSRFNKRIFIPEINTASSEELFLSLKVQKGFLGIRTDINKCFINKTGCNTSMDDWIELLGPDDLVSIGIDSASGCDYTVSRVNDTFISQHSLQELDRITSESHSTLQSINRLERTNQLAITPTIYELDINR